MTRTFRATAVAATLVAAALTLSACGAPAETADPGAGSEPAAAAGFPVTMTNMYGETVLEAAPERVATWGWGATDAVLALGIVPVAIASMDYGGGDDRITPWVKDALDELGGEAPEILDATAGVPIEDLLATDPDVLIAPYSGLTQEEYDAITGAGVPVIAPTDGIWTTPWRDVITETGQALGLEEDAAQILADMDAQVADAAAEHPEFAGTTIAYAADSVDTFYLYLPADPRVEILEDLGFVTADSVTALDDGAGGFYTTVSAENLDQIDAEVVFTQADDEAALETFLTSDRTRLIPAVAAGAVGAIVGEENVAAISPTALTFPFILPTMVEQLAEATAVAKG
ncbi:ABC transporter substrate-binding protein [Microbacterium sp. P06]|uniref:ABC transporter substrate-binding protein n=1 Tax=unclassified Microbacterium TaxID=2609290 RepID=UPI00374691D6